MRVGKSLLKNKIFFSSTSSLIAFFISNREAFVSTKSNNIGTCFLTVSGRILFDPNIKISCPDQAKRGKGQLNCFVRLFYLSSIYSLIKNSCSVDLIFKSSFLKRLFSSMAVAYSTCILYLPGVTRS